MQSYPQGLWGHPVVGYGGLMTDTSREWENPTQEESFEQVGNVLSLSDETIKEWFRRASYLNEKPGMLETIKNDLSTLPDFREMWTRDINKLHFKKQSGYIAYITDLCNRLQEKYEKEIFLYSPHVPTDHEIDLERIARAKAYPIPDLIAVKRGVAVCPWHDDHKPSLKYYPKDNHVWCFTEDRGGDAIDVYMVLHNCDFKTAVKALTP